MKLDDLKKKYGGRSESVGDTCCKPIVIDGRQTCMCTPTELAEKKYYDYCRMHGDQEKILAREKALDRALDNANKPRLSYPPLLPPSSLEAKLPGEVIELKPHPDGGVFSVRKFRPDSHLGGTEGEGSTEMDWYGEGYEYGV